MRQGTNVPVPFPGLHLQGVPEDSHGCSYKDKTSSSGSGIQTVTFKSECV